MDPTEPGTATENNIKKSILITLILILCSCQNSTKWYYGTWQLSGVEIREDKVKSQKKKNELKAGKVFMQSMFKGFELNIKEDKIIQELHGEKKISKYSVIRESSDKVVLKTELWGENVYFSKEGDLLSESEFYYSTYKRKESEPADESD